MLKRKLKCSFCGRGAQDVAKLVAGPRVYICDRCAEEAVRIMSAIDGQAAARTAPPGQDGAAHEGP